MFVVCLTLHLLFSLPFTFSNLAGEQILRHQATDALSRALNYMDKHADTVNLDAGLGVRLCEVMLEGFLKFNPEVFDYLGEDYRMQLETLRIKASDIIRKMTPYLKTNDPTYFRSVGEAVEPNRVILFYPSRSINRSMILKPLPCTESAFAETFSDRCIGEIMKAAKESPNSCDLSDDCVEYARAPGHKGYFLTHQVLWNQFLELRDCIGRSVVKELPSELRDSLCSNVYRDAEMTANANFPLSHRDLFMEQIGLCGIWGYQDFYKPEWLLNIMSWQKESGCYSNRLKYKCTENVEELSHVKVKREEKLLIDGCLSHKTSVAIVALTAMVRFCAEDVANEIAEQRNFGLNMFG